jgi:hypothetical protein
VVCDRRGTRTERCRGLVLEGDGSAEAVAVRGEGVGGNLAAEGDRDVAVDLGRKRKAELERLVERQLCRVR